VLNSLGMSRRLKGYDMARASIEEIITSEGVSEIRQIYDDCGVLFSTSADCVERNIRYAIESTWECGNMNEIDTVFGYTVDSERGKPTNSEFLFLIADYIRIKRKKTK